MGRPIEEKEYTHEKLGAAFAHALSNYDTQRRVEILIDKFLPDRELTGSKVLDVGCGLGFFSKRLKERGAIVTACDIGPNLVAHTRTVVGCEGEVVDALGLVDHFGKNSFDHVVSSECIEHTPDPAEALRHMAMVVKPNGLLSVSTPNLLWSPVVKAATWLKLRPFDGYENFSTWSGIRKTLNSCGVEIISEFGLHLYPFQFKLHPFSRWLDENAQFARYLMINICILGRKRDY